MRVAESGLAELQKHVDTLIVIPNQNLFRIANENTTFQEAFEMADEVLHSGVRGITDLITSPGLVNLDFAVAAGDYSSRAIARVVKGSIIRSLIAIAAATRCLESKILDCSSQNWKH
jgi:cell division protein FtsZ